MAVNTDSAVLVQRDPSSNGDFYDTEKLLSAGGAHPPGGPGAVGPAVRRPSDSLDVRASVRSLDAEQNGHRSPLKSGSVGQLAAAPRSSSRLSLASSVPPGPVPPSYLWLAVLSCLCPGVPLNVCALWYASVSRSVLNNGDVEAARKYGRVSLLLSCLAMLLGVAVIVFIVFTIGKELGHWNSSTNPNLSRSSITTSFGLCPKFCTRKEKEEEKHKSRRTDVTEDE
ncbi:trafficking regulator of GLUT4 1-like [Corythoichthys intestinalis]|uniref:trafficking regulator of GLUT4 1-like n=1 Tax=Corythoichthys intestinalis TaxID=161448 RepID=UPI0025A4D836|nr:trafficking regulator of GLUT4 1-like [Corythoichthys intestinalis]XP_061801291.1 trafficking regulator of GLUT4 1-like [Nerophis lumbriciformis]